MNGFYSQNTKQLLKSTLYHSGVTGGLLRGKASGKALILSYHRLATRDRLARETVMSGMFVSDASFRMQMDFIRENFRVVDLEQMVLRIRNRQRWDEPWCAITFDDGWRDVYEHAFPVLREYNLPATVFVVGSFFQSLYPDCFNLCFEVMTSGKALPDRLTGISQVDTFICSSRYPASDKARRTINLIRELPQEDFELCYRNLISFYEDNFPVHAHNRKYRTLSWSELRDMQRNGVQIGYHSRHHYMLTRIANAALLNELTLPEREAAENGVRFSRIFCYPDGQYNEAVIGALVQLGYAGATGLSPGFNSYCDDPYRLKRFNVHERVAARIEDFIYLLGMKQGA